MQLTSFRLGLLTLALSLTASAQQKCERVSGVVADDTGAVIPGAILKMDGTTQTADAAGRYSFACVTAGHHTVHTEMPGFAPIDSSIKAADAPLTLNVTMLVKGEDQVVEATKEPTGIDDENTGGSKTLNQSDLAGMADDPDDFKRELQVLAAAGGGAPGAATISIDGFQDSAALPPKGSIAFIRVNPDLFSAEYGDPPYMGGRIEIYTKPGQNKLHGALFITESPTFANARDPFALTRASLGKQRYGAELSGALIPNKMDFSLNLERRDIDNFAVINAYVPDSNGNATPYVANVPQGQHLWIASSRFGLQINKQNLATFTFVANVNNLENVGAGGNTLQEASYDQTQSEYAIRGTLITTISPRMVHEGRIAFQWDHNDNNPHSIAPSVSVAGGFTGGGATTGFLKDHENHLEINDDLLYNRGKHSLKLGVISFNIFQRQQIPTNFNGQYYFGGCVPNPNTVPATTCLTVSGTPSTTVGYNGLEQFRRAKLGLPGGDVTTYSITTGTPTINLTMSRNAFYVQDQYKLNQHIQLSAGIRWQIQNDPSMYAALNPRLGIAWSPDKKGKLVFRARTGLFANAVRTETTSEVFRLNGQRQVPALYYNVPYNTPTNGTAITTQRQFAGDVHQPLSWQNHFAVEYSFPKNWNVQANFYPVVAWSGMRTRNINQPLNNDPYGPRPITPDLNLLQIQQSARFHGLVEFIGLDQHNFRRWQAFVGYLHMDFSTNAENALATPQSALSDAGEYGRPSWQNSHRVFVVGTVTLPAKLQLTSNFDAASGSPYNLTTGLDNNGDGNFNDRPSYVSAPCNNTAQTVFCTRYGTLSKDSFAGAPVQRNMGIMPWTIHLDSNLSRQFKLGKALNEQKTLTANLRAANLLNHTNVSSMGTVIGTPQFDQPVSAESGRRIEAGLRFTF